METFLQILFIVGICLAGLYCWMPVGKGESLVIASNVVPGTVARHPGVVTRLLEADLTARKLLVRKGTDDDEILVGTAADKPLGVVDDVGSIGDRVAVELLGSASETKIMTASDEIAVDADVYGAAGGKVSALPVAAGTYWRVGRALTGSAADDDEIEIDPCAPVAVVVTE